eukprot:6447206-Ditylum_brightwellii.AAC.1
MLQQNWRLSQKKKKQKHSKGMMSGSRITNNIEMTLLSSSQSSKLGNNSEGKNDLARKKQQM